MYNSHTELVQVSATFYYAGGVVNSEDFKIFADLEDDIWFISHPSFMQEKDKNVIDWSCWNILDDGINWDGKEDVHIIRDAIHFEFNPLSMDGRKMSFIDRDRRELGDQEVFGHEVEKLVQYANRILAKTHVQERTVGKKHISTPRDYEGTSQENVVFYVLYSYENYQTGYEVLEWEVEHIILGLVENWGTIIKDVDTEETLGLYEKYAVFNRSGEFVPGSFVLKPETDSAARIALLHYARSIEDTNEKLAEDLRNWMLDLGVAANKAAGLYPVETVEEGA